jgi:lysine 2,3-aminomutase
VLRNYEGYITTYEEPEHYQSHDKVNCKYCQHPRTEAGQAGVGGLLEGDRLWIEPADFEQTHRRGNESAHRLQDPSKWVPYGVGPIEGKAGQPLPKLEPGPNGQTPATGPHSPTEPKFDYAAGEEPRPREGEPTGWSHGELL